MKKHYVHFLSPGTFVAEETVKEVDSWSIEKACEMARNIKERHGAVPYGFQFSTRERGTEDFDSKETDRTGTFYLGGKILTLDDVKKRNDPKDRILILNMECNHWDRIVVNENSWRWTQALEPGDNVLEFEMEAAK